MKGKFQHKKPARVQMYAPAAGVKCKQAAQEVERHFISKAKVADEARRECWEVKQVGSPPRVLHQLDARPLRRADHGKDRVQLLKSSRGLCILHFMC